MCVWFLKLIFACALVSQSTDCQFWGGNNYGRPRQSECPDEDTSTGFTCVPNYECPNYQPRLSKYFCPWTRGYGFVCCETATTEQGCGLLFGASGRQPDRILSAVVGGVPLREATTSPWMAAVGERLSNGSVAWYCGGSLINTYTVVTAAHCVVRRKPQLVRVGDLDLSRTNEPNASPEDVPIASMTVHPGYKLPSYYSDIALLHLARPVRVTKYARPVCLADNSTDTTAGKLATLTGWGYQSFGGDRSDVLHEVSVTLYNNTECGAAYAPPRVPAKNYPKGIIPSQLCAGDRQGGKDACQGDSGGPLVVKSGSTHTLVGIVSSGIGCGAKSFPGVYTRVSSFAEWIDKAVQSKSPPPSAGQQQQQQQQQQQYPGFFGRTNQYYDRQRFNPYFCGQYGC